MLTEFLRKVNAFFAANRKDLGIAVLVFLVGMVSFGLGRLSRSWPRSYPLVLENASDGSASADTEGTAAIGQALRGTPPPADAPSGTYVASRNGSAFHLPSCSGAKQIKDENKVWFQTKEDAVRAGYRPAANCPGL
ncbi:MAG: hypothetical protein A3B37_03905 [Candidatus Sungbacteria bacterium RIFCSPLOWO2_01_FULL_59_16]|uniref:Ada DNA repair metal-binding domain-containing protein n=1 Tax=Candidatus Sungbacteria bacterium RIFCSPLOWO2_01_FULL_59_16 TaxID=1802280 RepID=A0A1G2LCB9_9BACT|nr:MAG: hypothetical protein A3B37_03905 [Candidatus Sungbacteria bacterium RIFCSPLOWO2_01_FULL_59_16]